MKEFIDYARANPGKINYGSSGLGTTHHLSMEAVKAALKLDMAHVPFKGTGQSVPALLGGHVEVLFSAYPSLAGAVQANQVKLLATNGPKRSAQAPDVPAVAEFIPGFDFAPVIGVFAKAGTPKAAIDKIAAEAMAVMNMPEVIAQLAKVGVEPAARGAGRLRQGPQGGVRPRRRDREGGQHRAAVTRRTKRGKRPSHGPFSLLVRSWGTPARHVARPAAPCYATGVRRHGCPARSGSRHRSSPPTSQSSARRCRRSTPPAPTGSTSM